MLGNNALSKLKTVRLIGASDEEALYLCECIYSGGGATLR